MDSMRLVELTERVDRLERDNRVLRRRFRYVAFSAIVLSVGVGAVFQNIGRFEKAVEVIDANGTLRSVLYAVNNAGRSGLEIKDPQGRTRFGIRTNTQSDDPFIEFFDKNGNERIEMGVGINGEAYLVMRRGNGDAVHRIVAEN